MGYSGLGMQRWISTLKPRKFMAKRSKPDGGGIDGDSGPSIGDYYHLKSNKLENLQKIKFTPGYRKKLESEIREENHKQFILNIISFAVAVVFIISILAFLIIKFNWI